MLYRNRYRIPSTRLEGHDYSAPGWYFVTICTKEKIPLFGQIVSGAMQLSEIGQAAQELWLSIPKHYNHVGLGEWIVMPNHIHGIIIINAPNVEECDTKPRQINANQFGPQKSGSLPTVVGAYKASVTRWCRANGFGHFAWQPRFHDHIIRSEISLNAIRAYIRDNPANWNEDSEYQP